MQCTVPFGIGMLLKNAIIDTSYPHEGSQYFFLSLHQDQIEWESQVSKENLHFEYLSWIQTHVRY